MEEVKKQILKACHDFKVECLYWDRLHLTHEENGLRNYPAAWIRKTIELMNIMGGKNVVEIGSTRIELTPKCIDYFNESYNLKPSIKPPCCQDGHSTYFWAKAGFETYTVDIDQGCIEKIYNQYVHHLKEQIPFNLKMRIPEDGIEFLTNFNKPIDLLFLDGWNVGTHRYAEYHLEAFLAAKDKLAPLHLVSIDDCDYIMKEGGKDHLLSPYLLENGYVKIIWGRQNVFLKID